MRADDPQARLRRGPAADPERDDAAVPDDEVRRPRLRIPAVGLGQFGETGGAQSAAELVHRVRGGRGGVDESAQVLAENELSGQGRHDAIVADRGLASTAASVPPRPGGGGRAGGMLGV